MSFGIWRIVQILNKKDLNFWTAVTKTGSALVASARCMLVKSIFNEQETKRRVKQCTK